jgi:hypothetical protein
MNDAILQELKTVVERAVRPVRATMTRKRRMREELLAHLMTIFDEEAERLGDEQAALEQAKRRFGDPRELTGQLQQAVPRWDRCRSILENMGSQPDESAWHLAAKHLLVTFLIYGIALLAALPILLAFGRCYDLSFEGGFLGTVEEQLRFLGVALSMGLVVVPFNAALSIVLARLLRKIGPVLAGKRWGRSLLAVLCVIALPLAFSAVFAGAAVLFIVMARQAAEPWRYREEWV